MVHLFAIFIFVNPPLRTVHAFLLILVVDQSNGSVLTKLYPLASLYNTVQADLHYWTSISRQAEHIESSEVGFHHNLLLLSPLKFDSPKVEFASNQNMNPWT